MPEFTPAPSSGTATTTASPRASAEQFIFNGQPTGTFRESITTDRADGSASGALATGVMYGTAVACYAGDVISRVGFMANATAAVTPTAYWFAIYDQAFGFLRQTADQTTTAWSANQAKDIALTSSYTVTSDQIIYACCMVTAATVPGLRGYAHASAGLLNGLYPVGAVTQRIRAFTNGTGLTTTAPAGTITPSTTTGRAYAVLMG